MKNLIVVILLSAHLYSNTDTFQLAQIPKLVAHFHEHQLLNRSLCFVDFLVMHYSGDDGVKWDDSRDAELPFRDIKMHSWPVVASFFTKPLLPLAKITEVINVYIHHSPGFIPSAPVYNFFRPPISGFSC